MSLLGCPTCGKLHTTWYECLSCRKTMCNACYARGNKCPSCGKAGKKAVTKPAR